MFGVLRKRSQKGSSLKCCVTLLVHPRLQSVCINTMHVRVNDFFGKSRSLPKVTFPWRALLLKLPIDQLLDRHLEGLLNFHLRMPRYWPTKNTSQAEGNQWRLISAFSDRWSAT